MLIKFTEESNDVDTLTDDLNTITSKNVSTKEALISKSVIDVEIDELTCKESAHLDNLSFDLATQARLRTTKRQNRSLVQEKRRSQ